jgi:hypothetical protein
VNQGNFIVKTVEIPQVCQTVNPSGQAGQLVFKCRRVKPARLCKACNGIAIELAPKLVRERQRRLVMDAQVLSPNIPPICIMESVAK